MPKAVKGITPRRRAPATPAPYSFTAAVNEALADHPDAAIFAAVAEYCTAWAEIVKINANWMMPETISNFEAGYRAEAAEKQLLALAPTTPEGAAAFLRAVAEKVHTHMKLPSAYKVLGAAVKHAVAVGLA